MLKILFIALLVLAFFYPMYASWIFIGIALVVEVGLIIARKRDTFSYSAIMTQEEKVILDKYHFYFKMPFMAKSLSSSLSLIGLSACDYLGPVVTV